MSMRTPEFSHKILIGRKVPSYLSDLTNSATCLPTSKEYLPVEVHRLGSVCNGIEQYYRKTQAGPRCGEARGVTPGAPQPPRAGAVALCSSACLPGSLHLGNARLESREAHTTRFPSSRF